MSVEDTSRPTDPSEFGDNLQKHLSLNFNCGGVYGPSKIRVWVAIPTSDDPPFILNWDEPNGTVLQDYSESVMAPTLEEYQLDPPDGFGVWVFEGTVKVEYSQCGNPMDPPDWDCELTWEGEWRPPNDDEHNAWAAHEADNVTDHYDGQGSTNARVELFQEPTFERPGPLTYTDVVPAETIITAEYTMFTALDLIVHAIDKDEVEEP